MSTWNNEIEARDEIKNLVKNTIMNLRNQNRIRLLRKGIGSRMLPEFMMRKKCVLW